MVLNLLVQQQQLLLAHRLLPHLALLPLLYNVAHGLLLEPQRLELGPLELEEALGFPVEAQGDPP